MSGYLMRLARRVGTAGEAQSLQPFVRSTSPVAERDQRIGMPEFDGFGESSPAKAASETGEEPRETLPSPAPSGMPAARDMRETTVQRKMASPAESPMVSPTPGATAEGISRSASPTFETVPRLNSEAPAQPAPSPSPGLPPGRAETLASLPLANEKGEGGKLQGREQADAAVFPPDQASAARASHADLPPRAEPDRSQLSDVPLRSARRAGIDTPRLEPSARTSAGQQAEPAAGQAAADEAAEGPRVIIDRISVEVVPPPEQPGTAAPRSGPLTAASVSVIGPLGGGVASDRRFSLRYR